jgi:hypothetical protein
MIIKEAALAQWQNFYVIVGSSAGALTGLQFVVIVLIAEAQATKSMLEIRAFGTPTVVHFCAALLVSAILSAPWHTLSSAGLTVGAGGAAGVAYVLMIIRHARRQTGYSPDAEDWLWYAALPFVAYAALLVVGILLAWRFRSSLSVIAATALLLLFIGIHNAWDTVTYVAVNRSGPPKEANE